MNVPYNGKLLKLGSYGNPVFAVERALTKAGYAGFRQDKLYGPATGQAVKRFQEDHGLEADGKVGPATIRALGEFFDHYGYWLYTGYLANGIQLPTTFVPTHQTAGLDGFPAIDVFAPGGVQALAPAAGRIVNPHFIPWDRREAVGGWTLYLECKGGVYFLTHFGKLALTTTCKKGEVLGTVGAVPHSWWPSHIHEGLHRNPPV